MSISVFGIRHHGSGSAKSLRKALIELQPDIVLVEGPPDAEAVLPLCMHEEMRPPVALLIYAPDQPKRAVYYPFTTFSPEWQALHYSFEQGIPARFMDLPQAIQFARQMEKEQKQARAKEVPEQQLDRPAAAERIDTAEVVPQAQEAEQQPDQQQKVREDPLALLAEAAGYSDYEAWWEQQIEQRQDSTGVFAGILEAMAVLRADKPPFDDEEALREAYMRQSIRTAQKEGYQRIAVVCGAWHAPVLVEPGPGKEDERLLKGLKKLKVESTWIPWTNSRLSYRSGYGAGITSPGWYEHLWLYPEQTSIRWIARAAQLLRQQDMDASSASVIEAVRLGDTLAALRDLPLPGMAELHEAIKTVLCHGNDEPMQLIREQLEIGEILGAVPEETPAVPLQRDLERLQRQLRMQPSVEKTLLELDLRKESGLARSQLLHRLRLLHIEWGKPQHTGAGKQGTFWEHWQLQWQVEFAVNVIEANVWGNTVMAAATAFVHHQADTSTSLPELTELLDLVMLADLPEATAHLLSAVQNRAAISADIHHLMRSMLPLARVARYGNVRGTKTEQVLPILDGLFERVVISLPGACGSLDDDAARAMIADVNNVQEAISLLDRDESRTIWQTLLRRLMESESIHGLLRGRCCRLLLEQHVLESEEFQRQIRLILTPVIPAPEAAAWIEGMLFGSGMLVLHMDDLWLALDGWLRELPADMFDMLLPILRRAFSEFQAPERRSMGEKVKNLHDPAQGGARGGNGKGHVWHQKRAERVLPVLAQLMGVQLHDH